MSFFKDTSAFYFAILYTMTRAMRGFLTLGRDNPSSQHFYIRSSSIPFLWVAPRYSPAAVNYPRRGDAVSKAVFHEFSYNTLIGVEQLQLKNLTPLLQAQR